MLFFVYFSLFFAFLSADEKPEIDFTSHGQPLYESTVKYECNNDVCKSKEVEVKVYNSISGQMETYVPDYCSPDPYQYICSTFAKNPDFVQHRKKIKEDTEKLIAEIEEMAKQVPEPDCLPLCKKFRLNRVMLDKNNNIMWEKYTNPEERKCIECKQEQKKRYKHNPTNGITIGIGSLNAADIYVQKNNAPILALVQEVLPYSKSVFKELQLKNYITEDDYKFLSSRLDICSKNVELQLTDGFNASFMQNDLKKEQDCQLSLTVPAWLECANKETICYQVLFHELGHINNTCLIRILGLDLFEREKKNLPPRKSKYDDLANKLERRTFACLDKLSQPKDALFNACLDDPKEKLPVIMTEKTMASCGIGSYYKNQAQWSEAEADLVGNSAYSLYLANMKDKSSMNLSIMKSAAYFCPREPLPSSAKPEDKKNIRGLFEPDPSKCEGRLSSRYKTSPEPWDVHQEAKKRLNDNLFNNMDFRTNYGCNQRYGNSCSSSIH